MHYRQLGGTDLRVSELCLGSAWFGVAPLAGDVDALVGTALDGGITFFDTACSYGNQSRFDRPQAPPAHERASAEELLGRALKGHRDDVVLASKVGEPVDPDGASGAGRAHVERTLAQTLRRLQTDHLDLYYVHHPDPATANEDLIETFGSLVDRGLIRHWALSNFTGCQAIEIHDAARRAYSEAPVAHQVQYNLLRRAVEADTIPALARAEQAIVAYSGVAGGLLAGAVIARRRYSGVARIGRAPYSADQLTIADQLQQLADEHETSPSRLSLGWLLTRPGVVSTVIGPESADELAPTIEQFSRPVDEHLLAEVDALTWPRADLN